MRYRPDIDGLRAVAVTAVVAYHAGVPHSGGGFAGVDVFFVISGFLIGTLVYAEVRDRRFSITTFYARRARRILPALFGILLFCYAAAYALLAPAALQRLAWGALAAITSSSNLYFWRTSNYFASESAVNPLVMTWSLGVEEQFYIVFPWLMLLLRGVRWRMQFSILGGLSALSLAASIWTSLHHPDAGFFSLPTRAWELGAGVLLALLEANGSLLILTRRPQVRGVLGVIGFGMIAWAVVALDKDVPFPGYAALWPVLGATLIILARGGLANRLLSLKPVVFVGRISYSWYLWHWPLLSFARICAATKLSTAAGVSLALVSFGCAVLSYRFVERPFRKSPPADAKQLGGYAAFAVVLMAPPAIAIATGGFPWRSAQVQEVERTPSDLDSSGCLVTEPYAAIPLTPPCVPVGQSRAVALIGDSHAIQLTGALRTLGQSAGYRLLIFTKGWCPPLEGVSRGIEGTPDFALHCATFNRERLNYIVNDPNIQAVVAAGYWSYALQPETKAARYVAGNRDPRTVSETESGELLERGLDAMAGELEGAGKTLYLVQDNPDFSFDPPDLFETNLLASRLAVARLVHSSALPYREGLGPFPSSPAFKEARRRIARVASRHKGTHVIDLQEALCSETGCKYALGKDLLYVSPMHLSRLGAQMAMSKAQLP
jgi:peptidoglycan/LPS O-acetylase OafA/YrhL